MKKNFLTAFVIGALMLAACGENASTTATPTEAPKTVATNTPVPVATNTPAPVATNTPVPTATSTPVPTATSTPMPTATSTPAPTATSTPAPTATSTPTPEPTNTPTPEPTATPTESPNINVPTVGAIDIDTRKLGIAGQYEDWDYGYSIIIAENSKIYIKHFDSKVIYNITACEELTEGDKVFDNALFNRVYQLTGISDTGEEFTIYTDGIRVNTSLEGDYWDYWIDLAFTGMANSRREYPSEIVFSSDPIILDNIILDQKLLSNLVGSYLGEDYGKQDIFAITEDGYFCQFRNSSGTWTKDQIWNLISNSDSSEITIITREKKIIAQLEDSSYILSYKNSSSGEPFEGKKVKSLPKDIPALK